MDAGRLDELLDRYRDGALDAAGRAELAAALLADPALGASAAERLCLDVQLREALRVRPPRDAEATFEAIEAALSEDRRLRIMRRVEDRIVWRPRRRALLLALPLAAAALLIAGLLYYYTRGSEPGEPTDPRTPVVQGIQGDATRVRGDGRDPIGARATVAPGERIETSERGAMTLRYRDGTMLALGHSTTLAFADAGPGKTLELSRGRLFARARPQPAGTPLVIRTPHARLAALGTNFSVIVEPDRTDVRVYSGAVSLANARGELRIAAGEDGSATAGEAPSRAIPVSPAPETANLPAPDDVLLFAPQGRLVGKAWRLVEDTEASTGFALEAPATGKRLMAADVGKAPSWAEFDFDAAEGIAYNVWVRGMSPAPSGAEEPGRMDSVFLKVDGGTGAFGRRQRRSQRLPPDLNLFNGFCLRPRYWWVGGDADIFQRKHQDEIPTTLTFARSGRHLLRLYAVETPMQIDAIWLARAQPTRPPPAPLYPPD